MKFARILCAVAFVGVSSFAANAKTTLLFNSFAPPNVPPHQVFTPWVKAIEQASGGNLSINVPPTSLAAPPEQMNLVRQGVADGAMIFNAFLEKSHPLVQLSLLPLAGATAEAQAVALWRTYKTYFENVGEYKDVVLLGFVAGPPGMIASLKDPITDLKQLSGAKTYSLPGTLAQAMGALGASVVPGPAVRSYELISKGTVDYYSGLSYDVAVSVNVAQFAKAVLEVPGGVFAPSFSFFMSKRKWDTLSDADKAAIEKVSGEALARLSRIWDQDNVRGKAKFEELKIPVKVASPEMMKELEEKWTKFGDQWVATANKAGIDGKAALAFYLAEVKKVAAEH